VFNPKTQELDQQATCSNRCFDDGRVASGLGRRQSSAKSNMARRYGMPIERKFLITSGSTGSGTPLLSMRRDIIRPLTRRSSVTAGRGELSQHRNLFHKTKANHRVPRAFENSWSALLDGG
jgi:hypothetical protein